MESTEHKTCYGTMFPDPLHPESDRWLTGKVFSYLLTRAGGAIRSGRNVEVDLVQWDDCRQCPEFTHCYQLCLARVALQSAVAEA